MLKMISWTQWISGMVILTGLYYLWVTIRYYRAELSAFLRGLARRRANANTKETNESKEERPG